MPEGSACEIENQNGVVTLKPLTHTACMVNSREVSEPCRLAQGKTLQNPANSLHTHCILGFW